MPSSTAGATSKGISSLSRSTRGNLKRRKTKKQHGRLKQLAGTLRKELKDDPLFYRRIATAAGDSDTIPLTSKELTDYFLYQKSLDPEWYAKYKDRLYLLQDYQKTLVDREQQSISTPDQHSLAYTTLSEMDDFWKKKTRQDNRKRYQYKKLQYLKEKRKQKQQQKLEEQEARQGVVEVQSPSEEKEQKSDGGEHNNYYNETKGENIGGGDVDQTPTRGIKKNEGQIESSSAFGSGSGVGNPAFASIDASSNTADVAALHTTNSSDLDNDRNANQQQARTPLDNNNHGTSLLLGESSIEAVANVGAATIAAVAGGGAAAVVAGMGTKTRTTNSDSSTHSDEMIHRDDHHHDYNEDDIPEDELMLLNQSIGTTPSRDYYYEYDGEGNPRGPNDRCGSGMDYSFSSNGDTVTTGRTGDVLSPLPPHFLDRSPDNGNAYTFFWDMRMSLEDAFKQAVDHPLPQTPESSIVGDDGDTGGIVNDTAIDNNDDNHHNVDKEAGQQQHEEVRSDNDDRALHVDDGAEEGQLQQLQQPFDEAHRDAQNDHHDKVNSYHSAMKDETSAMAMNNNHEHESYRNTLYSMAGAKEATTPTMTEQKDVLLQKIDDIVSSEMKQQSQNETMMSIMVREEEELEKENRQVQENSKDSGDDILDDILGDDGDSHLFVVGSGGEDTTASIDLQPRIMPTSAMALGSSTTFTSPLQPSEEQHQHQDDNDFATIVLEEDANNEKDGGGGGDNNQASTNFNSSLTRIHQNNHGLDEAALVTPITGSRNIANFSGMAGNNIFAAPLVPTNHEGRPFDGPHAEYHDDIPYGVVDGDVHIGDFHGVDDGDGDEVPSYVGVNSDGSVMAESITFVDGGSTMGDTLSEVDSTLRYQHEDGDGGLTGFPRYNTDELMARMAELEALRRRSATAGGTSTDELMARMAELEELRRRAASMKASSTALKEQEAVENGGGDDEIDELSDWLDAQLDAASTPSPTKKATASTPVRSTNAKRSTAKKSALAIDTQSGTSTISTVTTRDESKRKMEKSLQRGQSKWNNLARSKNSTATISKRSAPTNRTSRIPAYKPGQSSAAVAPMTHSGSNSWSPKRYNHNPGQSSVAAAPLTHSGSNSWSPKRYTHSPSSRDGKDGDKPEWRFPSKEEMAYMQAMGYGLGDDSFQQLLRGNHSFSPSNREPWKNPSKSDSSYYDHMLDSALATPPNNNSGEQGGALSPHGGPGWKLNSSRSEGGGRSAHFTFDGHDGNHGSGADGMWMNHSRADDRPYWRNPSKEDTGGHASYHGSGADGMWMNHSRSDGRPHWKNPSKEDAGGYSSSYLGPSGESSGYHGSRTGIWSPSSATSPNSPLDDRPQWRMPSKAELYAMSLDPFHKPEDNDDSANREICSLKWIPNLHDKVGGCEYCLSNATEEGKRAYEATGRHYAINRVRGGCSRNCFMFPRQEDEPPVRLCRNCFYITHKVPDEHPQEFFRGISPLNRSAVPKK